MTRTFAKGKQIYRSGELAKQVYLLQSGLVSVGAVGPDGQLTELYQAVAPQLIGIEALRGDPAYSTVATALNDTTLVAIPSGTAKDSLEGGSPALKLLSQALGAKFSAISELLRGIRTEGQALPCPPETITKLFATIHHVAAYNGEKKKDSVRVNWAAFKKYCHRVFLESPVRLEQAIYLLKNLGQADLEMIKDDTDPDPEAPEVLGYVRFRDLGALLEFSEFFRARAKSLGPSLALSSEKGLAGAPACAQPILAGIRQWNLNKHVAGGPNPALSMNLKKKKAS